MKFLFLIPTAFLAVLCWPPVFVWLCAVVMALVAVASFLTLFLRDGRAESS